MSFSLLTAASLAAFAPSPVPQQGGLHAASAPAVQAQDLDADKGEARPATAAVRTAFPLEAPGAAVSAAASTKRQKPGAAADSAELFDLPTRVASMITRPMVEVTADEAVVRGLAYKAILSESGLRYTPVVGRRANADVEFNLKSIEVGGEPLPLFSGSAIDSGSALQIDRGSAVESYRYDLEQIEQTFTFQEIPGSGNLVVRMGVKTGLSASMQDGEIVFQNDIAQVNYSRAFVLDASGVRTPIETTWSEGEIALTVPASYLAGATLPITIDPVLTSFVFAGGTLDDTKPDLAFDKSQNKYFVAFEDFVSATDSDLYGFSLSASGVVDSASFTILSLGSIDMRRPRVAVNQFNETFMVVAAGLPSGGTNKRIYGQRVEVTPAASTGLTVNSIFEINDSPGTYDCSTPDVAGNTFPSGINAFAVTWERRFNATDRDIHARIINIDETFATGRVNIDNSGLNDDYVPRISSSIGNTATADYYNVVWVRGNGSGTSVLGQILARRLYFNGTFDGPFPASTVTINSGSSNFAPVTTATLDQPLEAQGDLVHIVAYNTQFGATASVLANVVTMDGDVGTTVNISVMEDDDFAEDQRDVDITTDGKGFMMVYSERFSGADYDIYYCSGHLQDGPGNTFRPTLSERHLNLAFSSTVERHPAITSQFDGGIFTNPFDDDACAVWEDVRPSESQIEGATLDLDNNIPVFGAIAVGTQYCQAATNSSGGKGWLRAMALNQSVGSPKSLQAMNVTSNAFGYLLVANNSGFVTNPGGARGNLCAIGAGRYVNQITNSGSSRTLTSTVNPLSIPQPNGFTAIGAGETWYFQYWHRDVTTGGASTSNFTNAVSLTFTP